MSIDKKILSLLSKIIINKAEFNNICESDMVISVESKETETNSKGKYACYNVKCDDNRIYDIKVKNP